MTKITIAEMKRISKKNNYSWFDKETMDHHGTKIETQPNKDNIFIISNDDFYKTERVYLVCQWDSKTEKVKTLNNYNAFETLENAKNFIRSGESEN